MKTKDIVSAYNVIKNAKYQKLDDSDKIKLWKISRIMKPIATKYEDEINDAKEKLVPSDDFNEKLFKGQQYEIIKQKNLDEPLPMSDEEYQDFVLEFRKYKKLIEDALNELAEKEVEFDIETLSEDAFSKLLASNDWTLQQIELFDFIVEI